MSTTSTSSASAASAASSSAVPPSNVFASPWDAPAAASAAAAAAAVEAPPPVYPATIMALSEALGIPPLGVSTIIENNDRNMRDYGPFVIAPTDDETETDEDPIEELEAQRRRHDECMEMHNLQLEALRLKMRKKAAKKSYRNSKRLLRRVNHRIALRLRNH